jgi:hypothetical protein
MELSAKIILFLCLFPSLTSGQVNEFIVQPLYQPSYSLGSLAQSNTRANTLSFSKSKAIIFVPFRLGLRIKVRQHTYLVNVVATPSNSSSVFSLHDTIGNLLLYQQQFSRANLVGLDADIFRQFTVSDKTAIRLAVGVSSALVFKSRDSMHAISFNNSGSTIQTSTTKYSQHVLSAGPSVSAVARYNFYRSLYFQFAIKSIVAVRYSFGSEQISEVQRLNQNNPSSTHSLTSGHFATIFTSISPTISLSYAW